MLSKSSYLIMNKESGPSVEVKDAVLNQEKAYHPPKLEWIMGLVGPT